MRLVVDQIIAVEIECYKEGQKEEQPGQLLQIEYVFYSREDYFRNLLLNG